MKFISFGDTKPLTHDAWAVVTRSFFYEEPLSPSLFEVARVHLQGDEDIFCLCSRDSVERFVFAVDEDGLAPRLLGVWVPRDYAGNCTTEALVLRLASSLSAKREGLGVGFFCFAFAGLSLCGFSIWLSWSSALVGTVFGGALAGSVLLGYLAEVSRMRTLKKKLGF